MKRTQIRHQREQQRYSRVAYIVGEEEATSRWGPLYRLQAGHGASDLECVSHLERGDEGYGLAAEAKGWYDRKRRGRSGFGVEGDGLRGSREEISSIA